MAYDEYFDNSVFTGISTIESIDTDILLEGISGQNILSDGSIKSVNERFDINLSGNTMAINDGVVERVRLGEMEDGEVGLRITDRDGNVLINITGSTNLIQSKTGKMQLDLDEEQARWYDDKNLRIIVGKALKKF